MDGIQNMRNAFTEPSANNYLFKAFNYDNNLPLDALPLYAEKIWGVIKNHKDLNLPSQKVMVSNLRCSQIKMDALELIQTDLSQLKALGNKDINHTFGDDGKALLMKALGYFEENAKDYAKEVFVEKLADLKKTILNELFQLYETQIHHLKKTVYANFSKKLDKLQLEKGKIDQVIKTLKQDKAEAMIYAQSIIYKSVVLDNEWDKEVATEEIKETLENQEKGYIEKLVTLFIKFKESQIKKILTKNVNLLFDNLNENFWQKVAEIFKENMESSETEILEIFKQSFEMNETVAEGYLKLICDEVYGALEYEISAKTSDLNHYLMKKYL